MSAALYSFLKWSEMSEPLRITVHKPVPPAPIKPETSAADQLKEENAWLKATLLIAQASIAKTESLEINLGNVRNQLKAAQTALEQAEEKLAQTIKTKELQPDYDTWSPLDRFYVAKALCKDQFKVDPSEDQIQEVFGEVRVEEFKADILKRCTPVAPSPQGERGVGDTSRGGPRCEQGTFDPARSKCILAERP